jgi:teichuronic acid biosynthesis protein TuaE
LAAIAGSIDALVIYLTEKRRNDDSISIRQQLIENGMNELWRTYGLGIGGGSNDRIQEIKYKNDTKSMHNFWIEILVEGGIVAFCVFLIWYLFILIKLFIISEKSKNSFIIYVSRSLFLSMCFFAVGCISASSVIYMLQMWLMFAMGISIIYIERNLSFSRKVLN